MNWLSISIPGRLLALWYWAWSYDGYVIQIISWGFGQVQQILRLAPLEAAMKVSIDRSLQKPQAAGPRGRGVITQDPCRLPRSPWLSAMVVAYRYLRSPCSPFSSPFSVGNPSVAWGYTILYKATGGFLALLWSQRVTTMASASARSSSDTASGRAVVVHGTGPKKLTSDDLVG